MPYADPAARKAYVQQWAKERNANARRLGLCLKCKSAPRPEGRSCCPKCDRAARRSNRKYYNRTKPTRRRWRCSVCKERGHNRITCPDKPLPVCVRCGDRVTGNHECMPTLYEVASGRRDVA